MTRQWNVYALTGLLAAPALAAQPVRISKDKYLDKCRGAWIGQMVGVCYGAPYEFRSNGAPITKDLEPWKPQRIEGAIGQDDIYVEMTFLKALEDHSLDITYEQAGKAFGESQYPLWHANRSGRTNVRMGIMPPQSGHPEFNRHADDIDFQIEADLLGILCPGLPQESNRLCDIFGHIMNYGDGVYGGMFVSGMYAEAYLEDRDVMKVIRAGLACIPVESLYHKCISDVIAWHKDQPEDWLAVWKKIEEKWQDDVDCSPGNPFNIDAKLNGAYIVMGLLYGDGDFLKTIEISTRCGQDADCNPSNAAGVLGCMKGFAALGENITGGVKVIADTMFSHTDYSWNSLIPACQKVTEKIIQRTGGKIDGDAYVIARQSPEAAPLEQWTDQEKTLKDIVSQRELDGWMPNFRVRACGPDLDPGVREMAWGRPNILKLHPLGPEEPAILRGRMKVPDGLTRPQLRFGIKSEADGDFLLKLEINDEMALEKVIDTKEGWLDLAVDLKAKPGSTIRLKFENCPHGKWFNESMFLTRLQIVDVTSSAPR